MGEFVHLVFGRWISRVAMMIWLSSAVSTAAIFNVGGLDVTSDQKITYQDLARSIPKGAIVVIGEQHNFGPIQKDQLLLMEALRGQNHQIDVAMEFLKYTDQDKVQSYRSGALSEGDFLNCCWGEANFRFYRSQILFPQYLRDEETLAINSPKSLPLAVKTKGLSQLTEEEKALLPPNFQLGSEEYRNRFMDRMKDHVPSELARQKYFEAQSVWDDTMAWKICQAHGKSDHTILAVVGQFHIEFGYGLIERLKARCGSPKRPIISIYQFLFFNDEEITIDPFKPSVAGGLIADFLMTTMEEVEPYFYLRPFSSFGKGPNKAL